MRHLAILALLVPSAVAAQDHAHTPGMTHPGPAAVAVTQPGQAAFAAIAEIVRLLEADSTTDWTRVNLEALRRHLIDMDEVTMHAMASSTVIANGATFDITGTGRTREAIQRMLTAHATMLDQLSDYRASARVTATGARLTVTARTPNDPRIVAKIRGLGMIGLLALGDHHGPHHLALARGTQAGHAH